MKKVYATNQGTTAIFLFIAELQGYKIGNYKGKLRYGQQCYINDKLHNPDITIEDGRKEFHEDIWLQRLYRDLDKFYNIDTTMFLTKKRTNAIKSKQYNRQHLWTVPIELDASASMLQITGALLNESRLLTRTNVIGNTLQDAWYIQGLSRPKAKKASTPMLYGSDKQAHELWQQNKLEYTYDDIKAFNSEINSGALGIANSFKDFIINNCKPQETMSINIDNEIFTIQCNRYKNIGAETIAYDIYDSEHQVIRQIHHTHTHKEADLEQFRRFFMTCLIHNLDSQIMNRVAIKTMDKYNWAIDIHDAILINPESALDVRKWYAEELQGIYSRRKAILSNYFNSIGISRESQVSWDKLQSKIQPLQGDFKCNLMALK